MVPRMPETVLFPTATSNLADIIQGRVCSTMSIAVLVASPVEPAHRTVKQQPVYPRSTQGLRGCKDHWFGGSFQAMILSAQLQPPCVDRA